MNLAINMDYPTLYLAQDSPASVLSRMAALVTQNDISTTARLLTTDERYVIADKLKDKRETLVIERGSVTVEGIENRVIALAEWLGEPPKVLYVDNLIDMIVEGTSHGDHSFYTRLLPALKRLANAYNMAIICLHHVTRSGNAGHASGREPMEMGNLLHAGEREARHVWGVYNNGEDQMNVQILKQQDGAADPDGGLEIPLNWHPRMGSLRSKVM